jgi:hypothetical protein
MFSNEKVRENFLFDFLFRVGSDTVTFYWTVALIESRLGGESRWVFTGAKVSGFFFRKNLAKFIILLNIQVRIRSTG